MDGARGGFIWNVAIAAGKTFIDFGEYWERMLESFHPDKRTGSVPLKL
jgi:hypothetical protein